MPTVLPFDADRPRTPTAGGPTPGAAPAPRRSLTERLAERPAPVATPRETPLSTRAVRAIAAPELIAPRARARAAAVGAPSAAAALDERAIARAFFPLMLLVAALDLATKSFAVAGLGADAIPVAGPFALHLVHNPASAGSVWLGAHTRALNFTATGVILGVLVMLVPSLARVDRAGPRAIALMAGGALGNLVSLALDRRGVPDFLAIRFAEGAWILNVADLAIYAGLALLVRSAVRVARAARRHGARHPVSSLA